MTVSIFAYSQSWVIQLAAAPNITTNTRNEIFDEYNICRINQKTDCRCVQQMVFGHDVFLRNDIRPCSGRFPAFSPMLGDFLPTREMMIGDLDRDDIAFIAFDDNLMKSNNVPQEAVRKLNDNFTCKSLDEVSRLCIKK